MLKHTKAQLEKAGYCYDTLAIHTTEALENLNRRRAYNIEFKKASREAQKTAEKDDK